MGLFTNMRNRILKLFGFDLTEKEKEKYSEEVILSSNNIDFWKKVYAGCAPWINYTVKTINAEKKPKKMKQVNGAKVVSKGLTKLLWAENPVINAEKSVMDVLTANDFYDVMATKLEYMCALGGIMIKPFVNSDDEIELDFYNADKFVPISWNSSKVLEADFFDYINYNGKKYVRIESHRINTFETVDDQGNVIGVGKDGYVVMNELFLIKEGKRKPVPLTTVPSLIGIEAKVELDVDEPQFVYIKMPEANNLDTDSPSGLSLFANAIDTLEMIDTCWNALNSEIVLGKKRIIVPVAALRTVALNVNGKTVLKRYFDPNDEAITAFDFDDTENLKVQDNTVEIRSEEIIAAFKAMLSVLSIQCGFDAGFIAFDGVSVKTATEVVSEKSDTFSTMKNVRNNVDKGIKRLIKLIEEMQGKTSKTEITISWDDSIVQDKQADYVYYAGLVNSGFMSKQTAMKQLNGWDDKKVNEEMALIQSETPTIMENTLGGEDE